MSEKPKIEIEKERLFKKQYLFYHKQGYNKEQSKDLASRDVREEYQKLSRW